MKMEKVKTKKSGMYWHCHHDILCEHVWDYDERVEAIKRKPKNEIKTRLRLFKKVENTPKELCEASEKYYEAIEKYGAAWDKYYEASEKYHKAIEKYDELRGKYKNKMEKLHTKECGCKEWNGEEIVFENGKRK